MLHLILLTIFSALAISLLWATSPITFTVIITFMALTASLFTGYTYTSLMALMMFLTYISGIVVLFAYIIASSNANVVKKFQFKWPMLSLTILSAPSMAHMKPLNNVNLLSPTPMTPPLTLTSHLIIGILALLLILLLTMFLVAKIAPIASAPFRPFK